MASLTPPHTPQKQKAQEVVKTPNSDKGKTSTQFTTTALVERDGKFFLAAGSFLPAPEESMTDTNRGYRTGYVANGEAVEGILLKKEVEVGSEQIAWKLLNGNNNSKPSFDTKPERGIATLFQDPVADVHEPAHGSGAAEFEPLAAVTIAASEMDDLVNLISKLSATQRKSVEAVTRWVVSGGTGQLCFQ
mmetsp:Transcript_13828/g.41665  ORF Transcript_13828/g.41665 Transcript_13828/m.41665 type:complete len:190 (-) Transcript_13828:95-664(-)|eukprot:CAMPEP_0174238476 /NCGR_PEP_ID=MMETSP0417-20130205/11342_1 /TAXON_ID=242541 /ORGANISM="Mayorella sp, Strain BSH-02190019" /LENGTH=189 /DNA_ID=CAMNT_0015317317 /DNA_START=122 /DNA_END=691 /DNA_ORIENTATION=-